MKKLFILIVGLILILLAGFMLMPKTKPESVPTKITTCPEVASTQIVEMKEGVFEPDPLSIKRCTQVTFKNLDQKSRWPASNLHPTHGIYPEFDPQQGIQPGDQWQFTFDKVGRWKYHDHIFPAIKGEIEVYE